MKRTPQKKGLQQEANEESLLPRISLPTPRGDEESSSLIKLGGLHSPTFKPERLISPKRGSSRESSADALTSTCCCRLLLVVCVIFCLYASTLVFFPESGCKVLRIFDPSVACPTTEAKPANAERVQMIGFPHSNQIIDLSSQPSMTAKHAKQYRLGMQPKT